jgi:hypothetical protein
MKVLPGNIIGAAIFLIVLRVKVQLALLIEALSTKKTVFSSLIFALPLA